jgi:hypothetical protein
MRQKIKPVEDDQEGDNFDPKSLKTRNSAQWFGSVGGWPPIGTGLVCLA